MASAIHPGSPVPSPEEATTLEPHAPKSFETHPRAASSRPPGSQALSWGSGSLGLTVLGGGGKTYTYSQCPGMGEAGSADRRGLLPKGQRPSNP